MFGLFGSVAHELHFCVCAGYRLALRYTGFGPSLAARVLATRNVLWIPKVTGSIFSGLCFWLA